VHRKADVIYTKPTPISLKSDSQFGGEAFVQQLIADDPAVLGLGDVEVWGKEKSQPGAGRLDILLQHTDQKRRYEVEIQLGPTDASHIVRTIEYWDNERRRYPTYDHIAVIVAESITSRFFNVIQLFNRSIPLIAIRMTAFEVGGHRSILFTRVLDYTSPTDEEEEEGGYQPVDRSYWEQKATPAIMKLADEFLGFFREIEPKAEFKFNRGNIKTAVDGVLRSFMALKPRKKHLRLSLKLSQAPEVEKSIESEGLEFDSYDPQTKKYHFQLAPKDVEEHRQFWKGIVKRSYDEFKGAALEVADQE
jgi:hypothetical protein